MYRETGIDAERAGITLELADGSQHHVYIKLGVLLADEPALKEMVSCKGHAGHHCCVLCKNCVLLNPPGGADSYAMHSDYCRDISNVDFSVSCMIIMS